MATATRVRTEYVSPPWWPAYPPHRKQKLALWGYERTPDLVYGGAAGGGKTDYLLMAASQFCAYPDYAALILRKTYRDLSLPGAILDRALEWWRGRYGIHYDATQHRFTWPTGAVVEFGHLEHADSHLRYQGAELQFIGIDEATQIPGRQLTYLHSRLRRSPDSEVPIRYRLATNPGGVSHDFIRDNYVKGADGRRKVYLPALLHENPGVDIDEYMAQLNELDPITRQQLLAGDWDVHLAGGFFEVDKIGVCSVEDVPLKAKVVRAWDTAATPDREGDDPDWTVGIKMALVDGEYWILDMERVRLGPGGVEGLKRRTAQLDGVGVPIHDEQEPGSSGVMMKHHMAGRVLPGYIYHVTRQNKKKYVRAKPFASAMANGLVHWAVEARGRDVAIAELRAFTDDPKQYAHDDIVDAMSLAHTALRPSAFRLAAEVVW